MKHLSAAEVESVAGGIAPAVGAGIGAVGDAVNAALGGGNAGQIVGGAILGGVAGFWGTLGVLNAVNAALLGGASTLLTARAQK